MAVFTYVLRRKSNIGYILEQKAPELAQAIRRRAAPARHAASDETCDRIHQEMTMTPVTRGCMQR
jgi:hypothetical protein